jgi:hypothetical protein
MVAHSTIAVLRRLRHTVTAVDSRAAWRAQPRLHGSMCCFDVVMPQ